MTVRLPSSTALSRRQLLTRLSAAALVPTLAPSLAARPAHAASFREITWDDLIPPGVPYGEIIGTGRINALEDTWVPEFDANGSKLNTALDGQPIRMPGYIIPFDISAEGVTSFMLVPYVGACIHTPPPPPNQLVFVTTATPWPSESLWDPVWVSGTLAAIPVETELANVGYQLTADTIEVYEW